MSIHVCILGPAGVGKGPLSSLFSLPGLDPLRVREPRNEKDKLVCISEVEATELLTKAKLTWPDGDDIARGDSHLFFNVREAKQCLRFKDDRGRPLLQSSRRIEIFGPTLRNILDDEEIRNAIGLSPSVVILLLNPTDKAYAAPPSDDLRQATFYAVTKRTELQRKPVDVPDALKRISHLASEVPAWVAIANNLGASCIEIKSWKHSEFRYLQPDGTTADACRELLSARNTVIAELSKRPAVAALLKVIRSPEEIRALKDIV